MVRLKKRRVSWNKAVAILLLVAACGGAVSTTAPPATVEPDLPTTDPTRFEAHLATIDRPIVVNVWGSWCPPCRAEAPLLDIAHEKYGDKIEFVGLDVRDTQAGARAHLSEFGLDFDHFFDRSRSVVNHYGGIGTPVTFFFAPGGELVFTKNGIMEDQELAVRIDELLNLGG